MGFFSGLTANGLLGAVGRMASAGGGPLAPAAPAYGSDGRDLLDRLRTAMDPERLAIAQALLAGDYRAVSRITEPLRRRRLAEREAAERNGESAKSFASQDKAALAGRGEPFEPLSSGGMPPQRGPDEGEIELAAYQVGAGAGMDPDGLRQRPPVGGAVRAETSRNEAALREKGLNGWGYTSRGGQDVHDLARLMYAEAFDVPEDMPAVGWVALNRSGRPGYRPTITDVIHQPGQFESVREGNRRGVDSRHWTRFDQPDLLTRDERRRRKQAFGFAEAILSGRQFDLTGGATHMQAPYANSPWFARAVRNGRLEPLPYRSKGTHPHRHLFYREAAPPKDR